MKDYIAIYSKHTAAVTAATNLKHIASCNGKKKNNNYQTLNAQYMLPTCCGLKDII